MRLISAQSCSVTVLPFPKIFSSLSYPVKLGLYTQKKREVRREKGGITSNILGKTRVLVCTFLLVLDCPVLLVMILWQTGQAKQHSISRNLELVIRCHIFSINRKANCNKKQWQERGDQDHRAWEEQQK